MIRSEKIRFGAVGVVNTAVDFAVLFLLAVGLGIPSMLANIGSTSVALSVSYLLNKKAVFRSTSTNNVRQFALFVAVTLVGLWVVQGSVIVVALEVLQSAGLHEATALLVAKLVATCFSFIWNYLWYSRVVFRKK